MQAKFAKGGHLKNATQANSSMNVKFNQNFTVNLPSTALNAMDDSLLQPSKATNFSTNISNDENSHRLPRINQNSKIGHLRINSMGGAESALSRPNQTNMSYSTSTPLRSIRVPHTSASPYRHGVNKSRFKDYRRMNKSHVAGFGPINIQDSKSPPPLDLTDIVDKPKITDRGLKMNPKIIESWINETLSDAEHLDIPGVLLKPEHK